uniref:Caspase family p20 domain-containing protein n=1 Tax=Anopheles christyi TaxID=43041 RepID=A0A182JU74_9DIPT
MSVPTPLSAHDEVDNNSRVLSQDASIPEIISSSMIHELQGVDDAHYDMRHERRGVAVIFNHRHFLHAPERKGTDADCENIRQVLADLQFEVRVFRDLRKKEIKQVLDDLAEENHKNSDCLLVVIMTHGDDDVLQANDGTFNVDRLWENFIGDACPSLLGKPKLFFIQACRGSSFDTGVHISQCALCDELREHGNRKELLQLLTSVSRRVAYEFQSNVPDNNQMDCRKQMPCIVSMLTRMVYFSMK